MIIFHLFSEVFMQRRGKNSSKGGWEDQLFSLGGDYFSLRVVLMDRLANCILNLFKDLNHLSDKKAETEKVCLCVCLGWGGGSF